MELRSDSRLLTTYSNRQRWRNRGQVGETGPYDIAAEIAPWPGPWQSIDAAQYLPPLARAADIGWDSVECGGSESAEATENRSGRERSALATVETLSKSLRALYNSVDLRSPVGVGHWMYLFSEGAAVCRLLAPHHPSSIRPNPGR